jgi:predicted O-methyltransferase YrrM
VRRLTKTAQIAGAEGPLALLPKGRRYVRLALEARIAGRMLRERAAAAATDGELLDLAWGFEYRSIRIKPIQVRSEIAELLAILKQRAPERLLEIGTAGGGSLFLFAQIAPPGATIVSVDLPAWQGYHPTREALYRAFARAGQRVCLVRRSSRAPETLAALERICDGRKLDFLFIDGDHSYAGVKHDFEMYSPLVRSGGLIAFHDIVPGEERFVGDVPQFWRDLRPSVESAELVESWSQGGAGIGLVHVP